MERIRFIIVGSGWRSLYYVRIAKALPKQFELCAMLCRTQEKASRMASENGIYATTSETECILMKPDVVVVVVNKPSIAEVSMHWLDLGFCVLSETPAALDVENLERLWTLHLGGAKLVVNEQYRRYPSLKSLIAVADSGILGGRSCLNISIAHEYHGASLMRALLGIPQNEQFSVSSKVFEFPTTETLTRYDSFVDGRVSQKKRFVATFEFESGKVAFYDFDSEQYRSPIRRNTVKLQGVRGEIVDYKVHYLDSGNRGVSSDIVVSSRKVRTESSNPNLCEFDEVTKVMFEDSILYSPPFGLCGLSEDETAMATMLRDAALYGKDLGPSPYPLEEALQDAYTMVLMQKALEKGIEIRSYRRAWN